MTHALASLDPAYWQSTAIKLIVAAILVPTTALILGIVFLFKVMSWMQSRKRKTSSPTGPTASSSRPRRSSC
jgi:hypothetical protein